MLGKNKQAVAKRKRSQGRCYWTLKGEQASARDSQLMCKDPEAGRA